MVVELKFLYWIKTCGELSSRELLILNWVNIGDLAIVCERCFPSLVPHSPGLLPPLGEKREEPSVFAGYAQVQETIVKLLSMWSHVLLGYYPQGLLKKPLYGEAPPRDPTTDPFLPFILYKWYPFHTPSLPGVACLLTVVNALSLKFKQITKPGNFFTFFAAIIPRISPFRRFTDGKTGFLVLDILQLVS